MYKFVIQCRELNGNLVPADEFGYKVIEAVEYNNWYNRNDEYQFVFATEITDEHKDCIPVGAVEFVLGHMKKFHGVENVKPINIPEELFTYANRFVKNIKRADVWELLSEYGELFVKSSEKIKQFTGICNARSNLSVCDYQVSEVIDIESEWRCFVRNGRLLDIKNYSGDFALMPDMARVHEMIDSYKSAPPAYTLDIAVTEGGETVIIEVHNFFSCGTYGFEDSKNYLGMLIAAYNWQVRQTERNEEV